MFFRKRADNANTTLLPNKPVVLTPTGEFDGVDGNWSTFTINIGDDATGRGQNFRVLVSTSSPITLVPQQRGDCDDTCAKNRGVELFQGKQPPGFRSDATQFWKENGLYSLPQPDWWSGKNLGNLNATWGTGTVGLGESSSSSPVQDGNWVVEYQFYDFYMGLFGLAIGDVNPGSGAKSPFLKNFAGPPAYSIPSASYGYTAGASYRNKPNGVLGNLVLGGYDRTRLSQNGANIPFPQKGPTLQVGVQSILYHPQPGIDTNTYSFTATSTGFSATIDSTLPYLWLPEDICNQFEDKFQLTYDSDANMYTVNSSAHSFNQQQNASVSFKIGQGPQDTTNNFATITLPYDAFDLSIGPPLAANTTNYFPIRRANDNFVLGRAFLQEAYIIVDYERHNFTVAPAVFPNPLPSQDVVSIYNTTYVLPTSSPEPPNNGGGLSGGAIAGIVVGIVVVFLLAGLGMFFWWKRRRQQEQQKKQTFDDNGTISDIDTVVAGNEVKHRRVSELDSEPPGSPKPSVGGYYGDREQKDVSPFPPINEMESPPAELYSPPPESTPQSVGGSDYFIVGNKVRRRGATRESSGNNTPGTPAAIAELPGDDGRFQVGGQHFDPVISPTQSPVHSRGPSDSSLQTNIDEVMGRPEAGTAAAHSKDEKPKEVEPGKPNKALKDVKEGTEESGHDEAEPTLERRPSHARGLSDNTIQSESTAVSQPTPEELEQWAMGGEEGQRRPLSE